MKILSKPFFIGLATTIGAVSAVFTMYFSLYPNAVETHRKDDIIGIWTSDYSYDTGGIIVRVNGETSYFSNGKYNVNADMSFQPDSTTIITFATNGAGDWNIHGKELITTLNTLKSTPTKMIYKGNVLGSQDFDMMERIFNEKLKTIEDFTATGISQSYIIKKDGHDKKLLEAINPFGKNYSIVMHREK
ncbi:TPA: hypothetical protein ACKQC7_002316 [Serratia marcescens]